MKTRGLTVSTMMIAALCSPVHAVVVHVPSEHATIQDAIVASSDGDEIVIAPGVYHETIDLLGRAITVRSSDGALVTTLDADGASSAIRCVSGEGPDTIIEGLTITHGQGDGGDTAGSGGGMYNFQSSPVVRQCRFVENHALLGGGGIFNEFSNVDVRECVFIDNTASYGGGIYSRFASHPTIVGCTFENGQVAARGGGVYQNGGGVLLEGCVFDRNGSSAETGGGLHLFFCVSTVVDCTFLDNTAAGNGGAVYVNTISQPTTISGCMMTGNSASNGGGVYVSSGAVTISDTQICANVPQNTAGVFTDGGGNEIASVCAPSCPADTDGDQDVDVDDLVAVILDWGTDGSANNGDVAPDEVVDVDDLVAVLLAWGDC